VRINDDDDNVKFTMKYSEIATQKDSVAVVHNLTMRGATHSNDTDRCTEPE